MGSRNSTAEQYKHRLIDRAAAELDKREQVQDMIDNTRVFLGTLASLAGKNELFALKQFDVAIIDEASQALEAQLLPILMHVPKFILIGDPRQLPAIVVQPENETAVHDEALREQGITNLRQSYFERLLARLMQLGRTDSYCLLRHQGRMHEELMQFPNTAYYESQLTPAEFKPIYERQTAPFFMPTTQNGTPWLAHRLAFVHCAPPEVEALTALQGSKACPWEIDPLLQSINGILKYYLTQWKSDGGADTAAFLEDFTQNRLGIITPYRDQIAQIQARLYQLGEQYSLPQIAELAVDTVERYQGSQRDHILVSFSTKTTWQLDTLSVSEVSARWLAPQEAPLMVDRKLNVLLTRAKEQLILFGNRDLLQTATAYQPLLAHIDAQNCCFTHEFNES